MRKQLVWTAGSAAAAAGIWQHLQTTETQYSPAQLLIPEARSEAGVLPCIEYQATVPSRGKQLQKLVAGTIADPHDLLIIGGGATGTGCAVDAVTRC